MKIRYSARITVVVTGTITVLILAYGLLYEREAVGPREVLNALLFMTGVGVVVHLPMLIFSIGTVEERRIVLKTQWPKIYNEYVLRDGERFVISKRRVHLERGDGTLVPTTLREWLIARRDWRRIARMFPTID
ncbi:hypothetical protein [Glycomyces xiaoerkulensis]|uniref:hypothetical protein n=1 Tax=Glycomyces xiaoerkulensis TaxID=2038139 RepID=UPI000C25ADA6|nr:hypothetical protein [Glycomyces xiaoerkulensis]